mmetsp:Transcript_12553/g.18809  ORF Transcript_12553/g.18809 Transcript_12553/m.18809 type:complete len:807 (+) Transcript_12553:511-2931(+)
MIKMFSKDDILEQRIKTPAIQNKVLLQTIARASLCTMWFLTKLNLELKKMNKFFKKQEFFMYKRHLSLMKQIELMTKLGKKGNNLPKLRRAYSEHYRVLNLLSQYRNLNRTAIKRLLLKFDRYTQNNIEHEYIQMLGNQYFIESPCLDTMIDQVESIATRFLYPNHSEKFVINKLRVPTKAQEKSKMRWSFITGGWFGITLSLVLSSFLYYILIFQKYENQTTINDIYTSASFYLFRLALLPMILLFAISLDVILWEEFQINYIFIFELNYRKHIKSLELLRISLICICTWCSFFIGYMAMTIEDLEYNRYGGLSFLLPVIMYVLFLAWLLCPLNILYRPARVWLGITILRLVGAPFVKVQFRDFWLADQLTSMGTFLIQLQYAVCAYAPAVENNFGESVTEGVCTTAISWSVPVLSAWPSWVRLMQCFRRFYDTKEFHHLANAGKYMSFLVVAVIHIFDSNFNVDALRVTWIVANTVSTIYKLGWDIIRDWGLYPRSQEESVDEFEYRAPKSILGRLLGRSLLFRPIVYPFLVLTNTFLRFFWVPVLILTYYFPTVMRHSWLVFTLAILEILRRGIWNVIRLENEHLTNVGKYRVTRDIPLPYAPNMDSSDDLATSRSEKIMKFLFCFEGLFFIDKNRRALKFQNDNHSEITSIHGNESNFGDTVSECGSVLARQQSRMMDDRFRSLSLPGTVNNSPSSRKPRFSIELKETDSDDNVEMNESDENSHSTADKQEHIDILNVDEEEDVATYHSHSDVGDDLDDDVDAARAEMEFNNQLEKALLDEKEANPEVEVKTAIQRMSMDES